MLPLPSRDKKVILRSSDAAATTGLRGVLSEVEVRGRRKTAALTRSLNSTEANSLLSLASNT